MRTTPLPPARPPSPDAAAPRAPLLTPREAAAYLRLSYRTLDTDRCTRKLNIPFVKFGRAVRYRQADLDRFIESRMVGFEGGVRGFEGAAR